jgi:glycosyltransferase involved in cell wall biosynthesis
MSTSGILDGDAAGPSAAGGTQPALSIVMPLYNKEHEILRSIGSVVRQTVGGWELIVIDDGSTDASAQRVEQINDPRIAMFRQTNAGVAAARNAGAARARARFVAFLDADDEWDEDMVATLLGLQKSHPSARVLATGYRVRHFPDAGVEAVIRGLEANFETGLLDDYFSIAAQSDPPITSSSVAVERAALDAVGGFPVGLAAGEDLVTWARLAARYPIAFARGAHATFWAPADTTKRPGRRPAVPDRVAAALANLHVPGRDRYLAHWYRMRGVHYLQLEEPGNARREFRLALRRNPRDPMLWALLGVGLLPGFAGLILYRAFKARQRRRAQPANPGESLP